jgi:flagellin-like protein
MPRRGVSPIIGVILLVAITVVLAAVLYVMIGGLTHSSTEGTPIGTSLALGPVHEVQGSKPTASFCAVGHPCYEITIASVSSSVTMGSMEFVVKMSNGNTRIVQVGPAQISIVGLNNNVLAWTSVAKNKPFEITSWAKYVKGDSAASVLAGTDSIWVQFGDTQLNPTGQGFQLMVLGIGQFSSAETLPLP